jgi:fermentation-respiration switch protein FrsA (DUF1100 family)
VGQTQTVRNVAVALVALVGALVALLWGFQRRLIYLPSMGRVPSADEVIDGARDVTLPTSDGLRLGAWFIPAESSKHVTVLVANGNAGDRSLRSPLARALAHAGFAVLLFDYRGYGGNPGHPSEEGLAQDARAAHRWLTEEEGIQRERLVYFGESLGAAVVTELATTHPPGALVLRSPFTDLAALGRLHYPFLPVDALLRDRFPVVDQIRKVNVPTTVVYGAEDSIVPPVQSRAVADAAAGPTTIVEIKGVDHNDPALLNGPELIDAVVRLARRIEGPS